MLNPRILLQDNSNVVTHNFQSNGDNYIVGSNVGIGTTSPDITGFGYRTLTVVGGTSAGYAGVLELGSPTTNANGQNLGIIAFMDGSTRNAQIDVTRASSTSTSNMQFYTNGGSGIEERMRINSSGDVGIGETNPAHKLSIKATDDTRGILVNNTLTTSYAEVALKASREFRIGTGGSASATDARDRWYVYDATASTHRLTLDSSGNFGIGETSPTRRLVLDGTLGTASLEIKQNSDRIVYLGTGSSADNVDQPILLLYDAGVIKVNISSIADSYFNGGNVIIGGTGADQAGSFTAKSNGFIRGVLASGSNESSLINAISGVSNGFQLMNNASNEQEYRFHSSHTGGPGISFKIEKTGTITAAGDVIAYSDKRLKSNIKTLDGSKVYQYERSFFYKR